ncbi:hypothetical protein H1C71_011308 [Ictidomys tridecemlineatus]|nr:hypothetical protein H1C71_011308 [Ictidomys tridecemlineatus]
MASPHPSWKSSPFTTSHLKGTSSEGSKKQAFLFTSCMTLSKLLNLSLTLSIKPDNTVYRRKIINFKDLTSTWYIIRAKIYIALIVVLVLVNTIIAVAIATN